MKVCIFPSCVKREERTPEKSFSEEPVEKELPKRCDLLDKIVSDFPQNVPESEDHSDFEKDMDNYLTERQKNTKPVLDKDTVAHNLLGTKQEISNQQCQEIWEEAAMKSSKQAPLKDIRVSMSKKHWGSYTQKEPELPIFYYCNICFVGFDEERAWECHLAKCEYRPKEEKKIQNAMTTSFTKDPSKDVLHEKVIEDESWLVTSLPQGYECVDAMFVVEAEGTCMLQQQIPVEPEEQQLEIREQLKEPDNIVPDRGISSLEQVPEEQKEQDVHVPDRGLSSLEKDLLPPWPLSLLAGALEAEEEKEMMEQKLVLEPHFMRSAFMCVKGQLSEDFNGPEELSKDPLTVTEVPEVEKEPNEVVGEDASPVADFINLKIEPEEIQIKVACH